MERTLDIKLGCVHRGKMSSTFYKRGDGKERKAVKRMTRKRRKKRKNRLTGGK
jgi:hypothetical protein